MRRNTELSTSERNGVTGVAMPEFAAGAWAVLRLLDLTDKELHDGTTDLPSIGDYFSATQLRSDRWSALREAVEALSHGELKDEARERQLARARSLFQALAPIEEYWAFPGKGAFEHMRRLLETRNIDDLAVSARFEKAGIPASARFTSKPKRRSRSRARRTRRSSPTSRRLSRPCPILNRIKGTGARSTTPTELAGRPARQSGRSPSPYPRLQSLPPGGRSASDDLRARCAGKPGHR